MEKAIEIVNLKDRTNDFLFWTSKTEVERIEAAELSGHQYLNHKKNAQSVLQKVHGIINPRQG